MWDLIERQLENCLVLFELLEVENHDARSFIFESLLVQTQVVCQLNPL
jgi:hypothetical protein